MISQSPYMGSGQSIKVWVADLLERVTLRKRAGQMVGLHVGSFIVLQRETPWTMTLDDAKDAIRDHQVGSTTPFGTGSSPYNTAVVAGRVVNQLQRVAVNETRLDIPFLVPVDVIHDHAHIEGATVSLHNPVVAATRNPDLAERAARITVAEMAATGANQNHVPTADVVWEP